MAELCMCDACARIKAPPMGESASTHVHCQVEVPLPLLCRPVSRAHALSRFTYLRARVTRVLLSVTQRHVTISACVSRLLYASRSLFPMSVSVPPRHPVVDVCTECSVL